MAEATISPPQGFVLDEQVSETDELTPQAVTPPAGFVLDSQPTEQGLPERPAFTPSQGGVFGGAHAVPDQVVNPIEKGGRVLKQAWNVGVADVLHTLGESDSPAMFKAYEIQQARMSQREQAGDKRFDEKFLDQEFKEITWQLGQPAEARDDEDLKQIADVFPVGEDNNPFPKFNIPPGQDKGDYIADTIAGIGTFVAQLAFLKKVLPGAPSQLIWEIRNIATGGKPGKGAAINTALQGISQIPTGTVAGKGAKVVASGGLFGGLTHAEGGSPVDIAVNTAIGAGFAGWDIHKQNQWLKRFKSQLGKDGYNKLTKFKNTQEKQAHAAYQKDLKAAGNDGDKATAAQTKYRQNLRGINTELYRQGLKLKDSIDKTMDLISRKLHHGKLEGKEGKLARDIVEKGLTPEAAAEVAKIRLPKAKEPKFAKKGKPSTLEQILGTKAQRQAAKQGKAVQQAAVKAQTSRISPTKQVVATKQPQTPSATKIPPPTTIGAKKGSESVSPKAKPEKLPEGKTGIDVSQDSYVGELVEIDAKGRKISAPLHLRGDQLITVNELGEKFVHDKQEIKELVENPQNEITLSGAKGELASWKPLTPQITTPEQKPLTQEVKEKAKPKKKPRKVEIPRTVQGMTDKKLLAAIEYIKSKPQDTKAQKKKRTQQLDKLNKEYDQREREKASGVKRTKRYANRKKIEKDIKAHPTYEMTKDAFERKYDPFKGGVFYVPKEFAGEVKHAIENYPGLKFMITGDPAKGDDWDRAVYNRTDGGTMDIDEFLETLGRANSKYDAMTETIEVLEASESPYDVVLAAQWKMWQDGSFSQKEVDEATQKIYDKYEAYENDQKSRQVSKEVRGGKKEDTSQAKKGDDFDDFFDFQKEIAEKPERQTDLTGRPILQGGAKGEQTEFLDKADFKTEKEKQRINAKGDVKGQQDLFAAKPKPKPKKPSGGGSVGNVGMIGHDIDRGRIKVAMEAGKKPQTAQEILSYIGRAFNIPLRGKATHRKKLALGWFDPRGIGIRMKDVRSLTTGMHEIGHHIDWTLHDRISKKTPKETKKELMAIGKALYGNRQPVGGYKSEGFAEFIRMYLTEDEAMEKYPNLVKWFKEQYLPKNKDVAKKLNKTRDMITAWRMQGADARIDSQISNKKIKGTIAERAEKMMLWTDETQRDELAPIRRAMKKAGIKEEELRPDENPYQVAVARADKSGAVAEQFVLKYTTDLSGNRNGKGLREILTPIKDIKQFTRWIVAARSRLLHSRGINPGISRMDAEHVYEKYDSKVYQTALKEITDWNHRVLNYLVEAGGFDPLAARRMKQLNPIYIPFMRAFKEGELNIGKGAGSGIAKVGKAVKAIKGSGREIINPLESMIKQTAKIISIAHKAEVAQALAKMSLKKGSASMIWKVPPPLQATQVKAEQLKKDIARLAYERFGLDPEQINSGMLEHWDEVFTVFSNAGHYYGKDNIVSLVIKGKQQFFEVEPNLFRAIQGLDRYSLPAFFDFFFGKPARAVRLGATGLNPAFGLIRNFLRDALTFTVQSKHAKAGPVSAAKGVAQDILDTKEAKLFKAVGGKMASQILRDRKAVQHLQKRVLVNTVAGKTIYTVAHPVDALRELFGVTEAGTRIGEFSAALKFGEKKWGKNSKAAMIYALNQAQDVTTNFTRHGRIGKILNQVIPFYNAAIQGPDKMVRTLKERPILTLFRAIVGLTLPAIFLWWKYKDEEWYKELPTHERNNYLHFRIPGKQTIIRIPVPFELGHIFQSAPVAWLDSKYKKDPKLVEEMFEHSLKDANPLDWPAAFGPIIDVLRNEDFAGRPIVTRSVENKLPEDQYEQYTTALMKELGRHLKYSPARLEFIVNSYSGGLYTRVSRTIDLKSKKEITASDMPVLGTLFLRESYAPKLQLNRFYERRELLDRKYSSKKITAKEAAERKVYSKVSKILSAYWKKLPDAKTAKEKIVIYKEMRRLVKITNEAAERINSN